MAPKKGTKTDWPVVAARIPPDLRSRLVEKHKKDGDISKLIHILLQKYIEGRIIGVRLESQQSQSLS